MKCERCGGPAPVEGDTYRHYWPCGCAVTPAKVFEAPSPRNNGERVWYARGLGTTQMHPTRDGAIAAWRAALGPYQAPISLAPVALAPQFVADFAAKVRGTLAASALRSASESELSTLLGDARPPTLSAETKATLAAWRAALGPYQAPISLAPVALAPQFVADFAAKVRGTLAASALRSASESELSTLLGDARPPTLSAETKATLARHQAQASGVRCPCPKCRTWIGFARYGGWAEGACECGHMWSVTV